MREVVGIERRPGGAVLKLTCSHQIWAAGFPQSRDDHLTPLMRPCLSGCYQPQLAMGDDRR